MEQHQANKPNQVSESPLDGAAPEPAPMREYLEPRYYDDKSGLKRALVYLLILVLLAAAGGGLYWLKNHHKPAAKTNSPPAVSPSAAQSQASSPITSATKHYDSPNFYLGIDYPADWTLADSGGGKMTIVSPKLQLKDALGQSTSGQIVLTITQKGQNLTAFNAGSAAAVLDSQKVTYTKPTQTQRDNTYLSFLQYAATTAHGALDAVYITGDLGYQKLQDIPKSDIAQIDPEIVLSFVNSSGQPLSIASSSWSDGAFSGPLIKMLTSLAIQ